MVERVEVRTSGPRVAVVLPVHDQEAWLPAALHSLRAQTGEDMPKP